MVGVLYPYTCIEDDRVHNACPACEYCILKAGYASVAERDKEVTAPHDT